MYELSALDFKAVLREWKKFEGGIINKIWQDKNELELEVFVPGDDRYNLVLAPGKIYVTRFKRDRPDRPPNFCMYLRKHIQRSTIHRIKQHGLDRIVTFHLGDHRLIFELFGNGNVILTDQEHVIVAAMQTREWKTRSIYPGETYQYPPSEAGKLATETGLKTVLAESDAPVVNVLGQKLGGTYAEEILYRADVDKDTPAKLLTGETLDAVISAAQRLLHRLEDNRLNPRIYYDGDTPVVVAPIQFETFTDHAEEVFTVFNEAVDVFYTERVQTRQEKKYEERVEDERGKLQHIKQEQERKIEELEEDAESFHRFGELLYKNYSVVDTIIERLHAARKQLPAEKVQQQLEQERENGVWEAEMIESFDVDRGKAVIDVGESVEIDVRMNVEKNAEHYYQHAKKARKKVEGAVNALQETEEKLERVEERVQERVEQPDTPARKQEKEWFEKFRWFHSSTGELVISGRDATQNDIIVKKHGNPNSLMFHADVHGSPFTVVVERKEEDVDAETREEAAVFTGIMSSAWKKGVGSVDVYSFAGEQAVKVSGLPKGAFQIQGDRTYYRNVELKAAVCVHEENVMCGPVSAVENHAKHFVIVEPGGSNRKKDVAEQVARHLNEHGDRNVSAEDVIHVLPPGDCRVAEYV